jgi:hypothetical protein
MVEPYRVVFHDFLSEEEINWMIGYSKPKLSRERIVAKSNDEGEKYEFREGRRKKIVHKTVQVWFNDVEFNEMPILDQAGNFMKPYHDEYGFKLINPLINKLSNRIEQATRFYMTLSSSKLYKFCFRGTPQSSFM